MKIALLIIDVQNDYFPNGKMELNGSLKASVNIKDLIEYFRNLKMPIVHIQHISTKQGATFLLPNTTGSEFHENVKPIDGEKVFVKNFPNSFRNTKLNDYLRENDISTLVIVGMMTHMCVDTTVRAAFDFGYENIVVSDCCATKSLSIFDKQISAEDVQNAFLASLNGIFSRVLKKDEVIKLLNS
jgi:nicotinamidase-related amidase